MQFSFERSKHMNFKKILSGVLAVMMTVTAVSLTAAISNAAEGDELVIHYSKIQKGNVDHKDKVNSSCILYSPLFLKNNGNQNW